MSVQSAFIPGDIRVLPDDTPPDPSVKEETTKENDMHENVEELPENGGNLQEKMEMPIESNP